MRARAGLCGLCCARRVPGDPCRPSGLRARRVRYRSFDQAVQQGTQQEQKSKLEAQFGGTSLRHIRSHDRGLRRVRGRRKLLGQGIRQGERPDYGALYLAYNFSKNLYQGAGGTVPGGVIRTGRAGARPACRKPLWRKLRPCRVLREPGYLAEGLLSHRQPAPRVGSFGHLDARRFREPVESESPFAPRPAGRQAGHPDDRAPGRQQCLSFCRHVRDGDADRPGGALVVNDLFQSTNLAARWDPHGLGVRARSTGYVGQQIQDRVGFDLSGRCPRIRRLWRDRRWSCRAELIR